MLQNWTRRVRAHTGLWFVCGAALLLVGCQTDRPATVAAAGPRSPTVAFDSIDGLPRAQFNALVADLNAQAENMRLAVTPREQQAAYRVRGYFAAAVEDGKTTIDWVWDVFDRNERRAYRITGTAPANSGTDWNVADAPMLQAIARSSMQQLAAFLAVPGAEPAIPAPTREPPRLALADEHSPVSQTFPASVSAGLQ
jgi:hypothetical protein